MNFHWNFLHKRFDQFVQKLDRRSYHLLVVAQSSLINGTCSLPPIASMDYQPVLLSMPATSTPTPATGIDLRENAQLNGGPSSTSSLIRATVTRAQVVENQPTRFHYHLRSLGNLTQLWSRWRSLGISTNLFNLFVFHPLIQKYQLARGSWPVALE